MSNGINSAAIGGMIRTLRKGRGMSQAELAIKAGVERTSITNIETGKQRLGVDLLVKIADALDHDIEFGFIRRLPSWMDKFQAIMADSKPGEELRIPREVIEGIDKEFGLSALLHKGLTKIRGEQQPEPTAICTRCGVDRLKVLCPGTIQPCHYIAIGSGGLPVTFNAELSHENPPEAQV